MLIPVQFAYNKKKNYSQLFYPKTSLTFHSLGAILFPPGHRSVAPVKLSVG